MHGTSVVPKNKIIRMPFVTIGKCRLRGMRRQLVEESSAAFFWPPDDVGTVRCEVESLAVGLLVVAH